MRNLFSTVFVLLSLYSFSQVSKEDSKEKKDTKIEIQPNSVNNGPEKVKRDLPKSKAGSNSAIIEKDSKIELIEVAKKHYNDAELETTPNVDRKKINYLYSQSFVLTGNSITSKELEAYKKSFDVADYNLKRKQSENVKLLLDAKMGIYVELFSWDEVFKTYEKIETDSKK